MFLLYNIFIIQVKNIALIILFKFNVKENI